MRFRKLQIRCALALAIGLAAVMLLAGCGGRSQQIAPAIQAATVDSLDETLAELKALPTPNGVDPALFEELKDALAFLLTANNKQPTTARFASSPPTGSENRIDDLACSLDEGEYVLTWLYRNSGDYDQNGSVGISDITPIAIHFGEDAAPENEWIDGDSDGRVHISDITPIAMYFGANVHHYSVQSSHFFSGSFTETAQLVLSLAEGLEFPEGVPNDARLELQHPLGAEPEYLYWRVVPVDDEGNPGDASNTAEVSAAPPPPVRILSINPLGGVTGTEVTFNVVISGETPFDYEWDFGGGADPNESTEESPTVTLGAVDAYDASLFVQNAEGSAVKHFTLTVTTEPGEPPQIVSVSPTEGDSGTEATFTADVTGDGPFTYYWDFGGGASPNFVTDPAPTVTLSRGGTLPEPVRTYPASLTVTNSFGMTTHDFNLNISAWWHVLDIPYQSVLASTLTLTPEGCPAFINGYGQMGYRYMSYNGEVWEEEILPPAVYGALAYSPINGEPRSTGVSGGTTVGNIVYSWRSNSEWYSEDVSLNEGWVVTFSTDIALRVNDSPVACWSLVGEPFAIRVARRTAQGWQVETLPTPGMDPGSASVFVDSNERAVVLFMDSASPPSIWLAREQATGWELEQILADCDGMIAVQAPDGKLGLIAQKESSSMVVYAEQSAGGWDVSEVYAEEWPWMLWTRGLAFLASGQPVVLYTQQNQLTEEVQHFFAWPEGEGWGRRQLPQADWPPEEYWWSLWFLGFTHEGSAVLYTSTTEPVTVLFPMYW